VDWRKEKDRMMTPVDALLVSKAMVTVQTCVRILFIHYFL